MIASQGECRLLTRYDTLVVLCIDRCYNTRVLQPITFRCAAIQYVIGKYHRWMSIWHFVFWENLVSSPSLVELDVSFLQLKDVKWRYFLIRKVRALLEANLNPYAHCEQNYWYSDILINFRSDNNWMPCNMTTWHCWIWKELKCIFLEKKLTSFFPELHSFIWSYNILNYK